VPPQTGIAQDELARPWRLRRWKAEERDCKGAWRARRRKGATIGRECESVTAARRVNPFFKADSPARAPRRRRKSRPTRTKATQPMTRGPGSTSHTTGVLISECGEGEPPPAVVRLSISAENNDPVYDTGAQAHKSYSLGVGSWVQKERTTARASIAPPRGRCRRQRR
jgi:hypothetical protein